MHVIHIAKKPYTFIYFLNILLKHSESKEIQINSFLTNIERYYYCFFFYYFFLPFKSCFSQRGLPSRGLNRIFFQATVRKHSYKAKPFKCSKHTSLQKDGSMDRWVLNWRTGNRDTRTRRLGSAGLDVVYIPWSSTRGRGSGKRLLCGFMSTNPHVTVALEKENRPLYGVHQLLIIQTYFKSVHKERRSYIRFALL